MKSKILLMTVVGLLIVGFASADTVYVQNSQGMGLRHKLDYATQAVDDSQTYDKSYVRGKSTDTNDDWGKVWLQFDLSDVWATHNQADLASVSLTIWAENGTGRRFSVAGLSDGIDESWNMNTLSWDNAPGNDTASGTSLDTSKIYGGAALWTVQDASSDAIATDLSNNTLGSNFDQAASYQSIDGGTLDANTNLKNFLLTDTDGLVTLIGYDHTNSSNQNWWTGISGLYDNDVADGNVTADGTRVRDSVTLSLEFVPEPATLCLLGLGGLLLRKRRK